MKLNDFLEGKDVADFANEVGVSLQSIYRYKKGERIPEPKVMKRISEVTGGAVTADSFYQ